MTVRIPQYTIENQTNKSYKVKILAGLLLLISGFVVGYISSNFYVKKSLSSLQQRNDFLDNKNLEFEATINSQLSEISILKTDKKVKSEAMLQLQNQYQELIKTIDNLKSNISFYEQLLSPDKNNKGLRVFKASLNTNDDNQMLILSLAQKIERANTISGNLSLLVEGVKNEKKTSFSIDLKQQNKYKFKYFQTFNYEISLPEGFKPVRLVVELTPSSKKAKKIQQSYEWDELLKETG